MQAPDTPAMTQSQQYPHRRDGWDRDDHERFLMVRQQYLHDAAASSGSVHLVGCVRAHVTRHS